MSPTDRAVWLVNRERADRSVPLLNGSENNVTMVAGLYAEYLLSHNTFSHDADGRDPWQRLNDNRAIGACHDFLGVAENLVVMAGPGPSYQPFPLERAIYSWMYEGQSSSWGHRHMLLWRSYTDNGGWRGVEGFLGIGIAGGGPYQGPFDRAYPYADIVVLNVFDPCAAWAYPAPRSYLPAVGR